MKEGMKEGRKRRNNPIRALRLLTELIKLIGSHRPYLTELLFYHLIYNSVIAIVEEDSCY